jgi:hypothetical protein
MLLDEELPLSLSAVKDPLGAAVSSVFVVTIVFRTFHNVSNSSLLKSKLLLASSTNNPKLSPVIGS